MSCILAIDQGTSSSRAVLYDRGIRPLATAQQEFPQIYPRPGWVEHDPEAIWASVTAVTSDALAKAGASAADISAIGITNQRETTLIWDRESGQPIHRAIVWQDRRTAPKCEQLRAEGLEPTFSVKTGLLLDPYFAGTKIAWLLDHVDGARARAEASELAFGTVDTFLIWKLTGGRLEPVLDTLRYLKHETRVWFELTTLLIPGENDGDDELERLARWFVENLGPDVPLHFSAFHPDYKMTDVPPTPAATLQRARKIAMAAGLHYVYVGNVHDTEGDSTYCPGCGGRVIERDWYRLGEWRLTDGGRCAHCGHAIASVFEDRPGDWGPRRLPVSMHEPVETPSPVR